MKIVLLKDVKNLGRKWQTCDVSDGYARNVLIPNKQASPATPGMVARAEQQQKLQSDSASRVAKSKEATVAELEGAVVEIDAKANAQGELYAAVSPEMIVGQLKRMDISVPKRALEISKPIKHVGEHGVEASLGKGKRAQFKVQVSAK